MGVSTYLQLLRIELQRTTAYRAVMVLSVLTGPLFFAVQYFIWKAIYAQQAMVAGYSFAAMIQYYAISSIIIYTLYSDAAEVIERRVLHGEMNVVLLRPVNMLGELLMRMAGNRLWAIALEFIPIAILYAVIIGPEVLVPQGNWVAAALLLPIGMLLMFLIRYMTGLVAFWTQKNHGMYIFILFLGFVLTGMLFPLDIAPMWIQEIIFWLPWQFMLFAPAAIWTGRYSLAGVTDPWIVVGIAIIQAVSLIVIASIMQHYAYQKYQGVGQ